MHESLGDREALREFREDNPELKHCELIQVDCRACEMCPKNPVVSIDRDDAVDIADDWLQHALYASEELQMLEMGFKVDPSAKKRLELKLLLSTQHAIHMKQEADRISTSKGTDLDAGEREEQVRLADRRAKFYDKS